MVFGRIGDLICQLPPSVSSALDLMSPRNAQTQTHDDAADSGPPSCSSSSSSYAFPRKTNLRLSSSLQDLSSYETALHILPSSKDKDKDRDRDRDRPFNLPSNNNASASASASNRCLRSSLVFLCLLLLLLLFLFYLFALSLWSPTASKFYVVLDSGSTGTRVYVYQASLISPHSATATATALPILINSLAHRPLRNPSPLSSRAYDRVETEPGFHKLLHNTSGLNAAIKPLLRWAEKQIPRRAHKATSVFLYATAGVRRLPAADSSWLLDNAWSVLQTSPFLCRREWVKVISGTEEAYFGWIALNHQTGVLGARPRMPTFGALDLGGSSLQVTFESDQHVATSETNLNLRIGKVSHHLTAYSLSGYGLNDAFDKSVAHLFKRLPVKDVAKAELSIKHPCLQLGYQENYICSQCASSDNQQGGAPAVSEAGRKLGTIVRLIGAPNWDECSALAKVAVNVSEWSNITPGIDCHLQPCALSVGFPRPYGQFYAMSGFYVVYRFFNLTSEATLDDVLEKGRGFCERTWEVARNSVAPQPFIEQYCFRAPYIVSLLREGLQITENQIVIGSGSITWTLGVALLEAGNTFSARMGFGEYEILQMKINPLVLVVILFISLILLVCALSYVGNWRPKFLRRPYLPLFRHNSATSASVLSISSPFRFQRWSPISYGDGRGKMPLSPTIGGGQERAVGFGFGFGSEIQLMESSLYPSSTSSVAHSYSSNNLGQMQFDGGGNTNGVASFWSPHRSQMRLQSRRSQSREDLNSSLADTHLLKV